MTCPVSGLTRLIDGARAASVWPLESAGARPETVTRRARRPSPGRTVSQRSAASGMKSASTTSDSSSPATETGW